MIGLYFNMQNDGTGVMSIYGGRFQDENFELKHTEAYLLSMVTFSFLGLNQLFMLTSPSFTGKQWQ